MTYDLPHSYKIKRAKGGLFEMTCNGTFVYCHKNLHRMFIVYANITKPADFQFIEEVTA
jgi:hypothetical protein